MKFPILRIFSDFRDLPCRCRAYGADQRELSLSRRRSNLPSPTQMFVSDRS